MKELVGMNKSTKINNSLRSLASEFIIDCSGFDEIEQMIKVEDGEASDSISI